MFKLRLRGIEIRCCDYSLGAGALGSKLLLCLVGVLVWGTACSDPTDELQIEPDAEPVILDVSNGYENLWGGAEKTAVDQFEVTHPQITVEVRQQDLSWPSLVAQSVLPDVVFGEIGYDLRQVSRQNQLTRLNDLWLEAGLFETLPTSLQTLSVLDGNQYYLPMVTNWVALYYNRALFEQYDLAPPQTWDEFLQVCDILQGEAIRPLAFGPADWTGMYWFDYLNLRLNGLEFHRNVLQGQVQFDDPRVQVVFETWRTLLERGCFGEAGSPMGLMDSRLAIVHGHEGVISQEQAAMTLVASWEMHSFAAQFETEIDFFRFPVLDRAVPIAEIVYAYGYAVPAKAAELEAAQRFLTYMSSVEAQTMLAQGLGPTAVSGNLNIDPAVLTPSQIKGVALLREAEGAAIAHFLAAPPLMVRKFEQALEMFVHQPDDIEAILFELETGRQEAVEQGVFN